MSFEVEIVQSPSNKFYNVTCDGCGIALKSATRPHGVTQTEDGEVWDCLQPEDTLIVNLQGGYGCAIDPMGDLLPSEETLLFCLECTRKLGQQWPAIGKTIQKACSASVGHHCSKVKEFVWETLVGCCGNFCSSCGEDGSYSIGYEVENDRYSRRIVQCDCGFVGPSKWGWEMTLRKGDSVVLVKEPFVPDEQAALETLELLKKMEV